MNGKNELTVEGLTLSLVHTKEGKAELHLYPCMAKSYPLLKVAEIAAIIIGCDARDVITEIGYNHIELKQKCA